MGTPGYLVLVLVLILQPLLPVVPEAVEGDRSSVGAVVVLGVVVPLQQRRYSPFLLHRLFELRQRLQRQRCHGDVVEEPLADGVRAHRPCVAVKHAKQHAATALKAGGVAPTVLAGAVGWQHVAMEIQDTMGGGATWEGVAVFVGLATEDAQIGTLIGGLIPGMMDFSHL